MVVIALIPSLVLGLVSFLSSTFILVRILLPILPSSPFSKLVPPKQFGRPNWGQLRAADIAHLWLTLFDVVSLVIFLAQVFHQYQEDTLAFEAATNGSAAARFWIALTARQTCFLIIISITLLYVRLGRPISFGAKYMYLWLPAMGMVGTGTIAASLLADAGFTSLFGGIAAYISVVTILSTGFFIGLIATLLRILRNLESDRLALEIDSWPALVEKKRRKSFSTDEVQALNDGSSWITSVEGSIRKSMSAWSFTTSNTHATKGKHMSRHSFPISVTSHTPSSILSDPKAVKTTFSYSIPPVPPLPSPYRPTRPEHIQREPSPSGSTNSWLTSISGTRETMSSFSFPTTRATSRTTTTSRRTAKHKALPTTTTTVVFPVSLHAATEESTIDNEDSGLHSLALRGEPVNHNVTFVRTLLWSAMVWLPYIFMMPYISLARNGYQSHSPVIGVLLALGVCIPSPLLALSLLFKVTLPIPSNLFTNKPQPVHTTRKSSDTHNPPRSSTALPASHRCSELRVRGKSGSYTVIEGRRSGDVWIENGQAVDGRSRAGRVMSLLAPHPKLSVLPPKNKEVLVTLPMEDRRRESSTQRSMQTNALLDEDVDEIALAPQRPRGLTETPSSVDELEGESMECHPPSTDRAEFPSLFRRLYGPSLSPPPTIPLPPIPDNIKQTLQRPTSPHAIDSLSAGMLPFLVPGLAIGDSQDIEPYTPAPQRVLTKARSKEWHRPKKPESPGVASDTPESGRELSSPFTSPEDCSTPRLYGSSNRRGHQSLPSLGKIISGDNPPDMIHKHTSVPSLDITEHGHELKTVSNIPSFNEEDTLTRKLNSLIRSLSSPTTSTPSSRASKGRHRKGRNQSDKENTPSTASTTRYAKGPVVEPLAPRRPMGVARHKPKAQRYSPFDGSPKLSPKRLGDITNGRASNGRQLRDSKSLYKVKLRSPAPSRLVETPCSIPTTITIGSEDSAPTTPASPAEYQPAINRLSSLLDINPKDTFKDLAEIPDEFNESRAPVAQHNTNEIVKQAYRESFVSVGDKENKEYQRLKVAATHLARSDTARRRSRLMHNQQLPVVVVRPPSGASFGEHNASVWMPSLSEML